MRSLVVFRHLEVRSLHTVDLAENLFASFPSRLIISFRYFVFFLLIVSLVQEIQFSTLLGHRSASAAFGTPVALIGDDDNVEAFNNGCRGCLVLLLLLFT